MKSRIFYLAIFTVLFAFLASAYAQDDDKGKDKKKDKEDKTNVHFKVDKNTIPKSVQPGETFTVNVDVSNKSKGTEWTSGNLSFEVEPPFMFAGSSLSKMALAPGEYGSIQVKIKAPDTEGKEVLKITAADNGKKSKQFVKNIMIGSSKSGSKDEGKSDDNSNKDKEKSKEKDKSKEKHKKND